MPERGIDVFDVERVPMTGIVSGPIRTGRREGEWKMLVVGELDRTSRKVGVATVLLREDRLVIATVEWEDR